MQTCIPATLIEISQRIGDIAASDARFVTALAARLDEMNLQPGDMTLDELLVIVDDHVSWMELMD